MVRMSCTATERNSSTERLVESSNSSFPVHVQIRSCHVVPLSSSGKYMKLRRPSRVACTVRAANSGCCPVAQALAAALKACLRLLSCWKKRERETKRERGRREGCERERKREREGRERREERGERREERGERREEKTAPLGTGCGRSPPRTTKG